MKISEIEIIELETIAHRYGHNASFNVVIKGERLTGYISFSTTYWAFYTSYDLNTYFTTIHEAVKSLLKEEMSIKSDTIKDIESILENIGENE